MIQVVILMVKNPTFSFLPTNLDINLSDKSELIVVIPLTDQDENELLR